MNPSPDATFHQVVPNITDPALLPDMTIGRKHVEEICDIDAGSTSFFQRHRFTIIIALVVVVIAIVILYMYMSKKGRSDVPKKGPVELPAENAPPPAIDLVEINRLREMRRVQRAAAQVAPARQQAQEAPARQQAQVAPPAVAPPAVAPPAVAPPAAAQVAAQVAAQLAPPAGVRVPPSGVRVPPSGVRAPAAAVVQAPAAAHVQERESAQPQAQSAHLSSASDDESRPASPRINQYVVGNPIPMEDMDDLISELTDIDA